MERAVRGTDARGHTLTSLSDHATHGHSTHCESISTRQTNAQNMLLSVWLFTLFLGWAFQSQLFTALTIPLTMMWLTSHRIRMDQYFEYLGFMKDGKLLNACQNERP